MNALGLLAASALLAVLGWRGPAPRLDLTLAVLSTVALVLELYPVRLRKGYFSCAAAAYLALGGIAAGVLATLAVGLRAVVWSGPKGLSLVLREALADLLPTLAALTMPNPVLAGLVYLALSPLTTAEPESRKLRALPWVGNVVAGVLLARVSPTLGWLFLPLLWQVQDSVRTRQRALDVHAYEEMKRWSQQNDRALQEAQAALDEASRKLAEQSREIQLKTEERVLLEDLNGALARSPDLDGTLDTLLTALGRIVRNQSVVFFLRSEDEVVPYRWRTPHADRLGGLLKLQEPAVVRCWQERRPVVAGTEGRLFPDETCAVALPLGDEGVLYVGRPSPAEFSSLERYLLTLLAGQSTLAIQSGRRFQAQHEALALHAAAHARLGGWVDRLAFVLESSRRLAAAETTDEILDQLGAALDHAWPHQAGLVFLNQELRREWPARYWTPVIMAEAQRLMSIVSETGVPLLFEGDDPNYPSLGAALPSLLVAPMLHGVVLVGHGTPGVYDREHRDLLQLECYQAGSLLERVGLLERVVSSHAELEEAYRQLELTQAQVVQTSKLAAIGQLAAGVAHELNTPLGSIVLALDIAVFKLGEETSVGKTLTDAMKAAERCRHIISKLMLYSRSSSKGVTELSLNQVVRDTLELLGPQLNLDGLAVKRELEATLPGARGNFGELQQVLTNLLVNARDAVLGRTGEVVVRTGARNGEVFLQVADRGCGIPPEVAERIFDPFFTTKPVGRGTGLGLTVSQQIVQQHGGRLEVESQVDVGTTFTMWLKADA